MKFNQYLNESEKEYLERIDQAVATIKDNCAPILDILKNSTKPLYRCTPDAVNSIKLKDSRIDRHPLNSSRKFHEYCDNFFLNKYGWKARSAGTFAWSNLFIGIFGARYLFFPVGDFKFLWSPYICDLYDFEFYTSIYTHSDEIFDYDKLRSINQSVHKNKIPTSLVGKKDTEVLDYLLSSYKSTDLLKAIKSQHEIMFKCDNYYLVNLPEIDFLPRLFK